MERQLSYGSMNYNYLCNQWLSPLNCEFESHSSRCSVLDTTLCDKVCQWLATGRWFSPGTLVSFTNKTDHHDIAEILLTFAVKHHKPNTNTKGSLRELSMWEIDRESIIKYWKMCSFILSDFSINMCNCCNFVIYLALININAVYLCEQHRRTISL